MSEKSNNLKTPIRVFLICPGLGHINRGFESFTQECFDALKQDSRLDIRLYSGAGQNSDREQALWCLKRNGFTAQMLGRLVRNSYFFEQATFSLSLIRHIRRHDPDVIYFSDGVIGNMLWRWRNLTRRRFKLVLSNGGPLGPPDFPRFDHVHQVSQVFYDESAAAGRKPETQTLIPYGFQIDREFKPPTNDERKALRKMLGLPLDRPIVLSVGAINSSHKRMDYLIREVAALPEPRPLLVMLGQIESETASIVVMADEMLGSSGYVCRNVPPNDVPKFYQASDVFVLGSLNEGFGRVLVEALSRGLTCLAADRPFARYVLGEHGTYGCFDQPGGLATVLAEVLPNCQESAYVSERHRVAYDRFSWAHLSTRYVSMFQKITNTTAPEVRQ